MKKRNILSCLAVLVLVALGIARLNVLLRPVDTAFRQSSHAWQVELSPCDMVIPFSSRT